MKPLAAGAIAVAGAGLAALAVYVELGLYYQAANGRDYGAVRWVLASGSTAVALGLALLIGLLAPAIAAARLQLPYRLAVIVSGLIFGFAVFWLLLYASIVNSCGVDAAFPFSFVGDCRGS